PWSGIGFTAPTPEQAAEVDARIQAALEWVDATFDQAEADGPEGVGIAQQAIVDRIAARTAAFDGDVLLLQGDTHTLVADNPLGLANFTRIVVHGETLPFDSLRLRADPRRDQRFSWERGPGGAPARPARGPAGPAPAANGSPARAPTRSRSPQATSPSTKRSARPSIS